MLDPLAHVWAKSGVSGLRGETLTAHTATVLARLVAWRERNPGLPTHGSSDDIWSVAAWACVLHDVGKAARGFQEMLRGGPRFPDRHEVLSLVAVGWLDLDERTRGLVAAGVATHHRDRAKIFEMYPAGSPAVTGLLAELRENEGAIREWLTGRLVDPARRGFAPLPTFRWCVAPEAFDRAMASLESLGSELDRLQATDPLALACRAVRGLVVLADHAGSAHERHARARSLGSVASFRSVLGSDWRAHDHQDALARTEGHALLIAPTGSGKTEAALLWAARQSELAAGSPPIFYVLPYRASLNAMHARIRDRYSVSADAVVLQHATATAALFKYLLESKGYDSTTAERVAKHGRNLARLMTAPVRVLTPYQLLRAFFGLRGHEATLTDATGGIFILDELHAYDVSRLGLILAAVEHLARDLGCRFLAMSATFPGVLRQALLDVLGAGVVEVRATSECEQAFRRHTLRIFDRDLLDPVALDAVAARARAGEATLVVVNTVARAQRAYDELRARLGEGVSMLHGRFTAGDRAAKELELARRVGNGRARPQGSSGTVLVATQVVEVSLDVDFDVLFTDPAPVEALVQRFGRVNRGRRGGLRDVVLSTAIPDEARTVYDPRIVAHAIDVLRPRAEAAIEESHVQGWVDAAYAPLADSWRRELLDKLDEAREAVINVNRPLDSHDELREQFDRLFDGQEVVPEFYAERHGALEREGSLEAAFLRVPVSFGQWMALRRSGRLEKDVARVPYDAERGLDLGFRDEQA